MRPGVSQTEKSGHILNAPGLHGCIGCIVNSHETEIDEFKKAWGNEKDCVLNV